MISVHIVSYNKSKHAINAVQSVLNQHLGFGSYEILLLECGVDPDNIKLFHDYKRNLLYSHETSIRYFTLLGNLGLARGLNFLSSVQDPKTKYIVELNEDMFFDPNAIQNLINGLESDNELGLACSNMVNTLYDKHNPKTEDVEDFAKRYTDNEPVKLGYGASNLPWALSVEFYHQLANFDVWSDRRALLFNNFMGIWDESIDPYGVGWYGDWCIHNRVAALGKKMAIVENAHVAHYDHCSGGEYDATLPNWTTTAWRNYSTKYEGTEKGLPVVKKLLPRAYPYLRVDS